MRRMTGRRFWRGSATLFGAVLLALFSTVFMASWYGAQAVLFQAEHARERGRMWGLTCLAAHRAVQAGLVTSARAVTLAELRQPGTTFQPFLPAGMQPVDEAGVLAAGYGAVLVDGAPMAVCSLAGSGVARRHPALRAGAVMAGLEVVGEVGGPNTVMHAHLAAVQGVLGALARGSLFVTADFGLAHAIERVHRRAVGGRPELAVMDRALAFAGGWSMVGVGAVGAGAVETAAGAAAGDVAVGGDAVLRSSLIVEATTAVSATGGFAFGGTQAGAQTVFAIPGELGIGTSMRARGRVAAGRMTLSGTLRADSCNGCSPPPLGP